MVEKVLEDAPHVCSRMILNLLIAITAPIQGFTSLHPSEEILAVFESSIQNMLLRIIQYARKRKLIDNSKGMNLAIVGYGTWKLTDELDV